MKKRTSEKRPPPRFMGFGSDEETVTKTAKYHRQWREAELLNEKRRGDELVESLGRTISEINQSIMPPDLRWPTQKALNDVVVQVDRLCRYLDRKDTRFFWENCAFVEDRKSTLHLHKSISKLVDRAAAVDERPLTKYLVTSNQGGDTAEIAKAFIQILPKLAARSVEVAKVDWTKFEPLFLEFGVSVVETRIGKAAGHPTLQCYAKCMEVLLDDLDWKRRHGKGSMMMLAWAAANFEGAHPVFQKMQRFASFPDSPEYHVRSVIDLMLKYEDGKKRAYARKRKREERSKKIGKTA